MGKTNGVNTPFFDKNAKITNGSDNRQLEHAKEFMESQGILTNDEITELASSAKEGSLESMEELMEIASQFDLAVGDSPNPELIANQLIALMANQDAPNTFTGTE
jgi:hypothetical protein